MFKDNGLNHHYEFGVWWKLSVSLPWCFSLACSRLTDKLSIGFQFQWKLSQVQLIFNFNENWSSDSHEWSTYYTRLSRCQAFMMLKLSPFMLLINIKLGCLETLVSGNTGKRLEGDTMWIFLRNTSRVSYMQGSIPTVSLGIVETVIR